MIATILVGALAFVVMIVVVVGIHELGHFATAKWSGIRVDEFAIGFGPRVLSRRRGETLYSVRALPLGGFVKMPGMSALEEDDGGPRGFMHAPLWKQLVVLLAGVTMNFLLAGVLIGVLNTHSYDASVIPNLPAAMAGLAPRDVIISVDGGSVDPTDPVAVSSALHNATDTRPGQRVELVVRHADGSTARLDIAPALVVDDLDDSQPLTVAGKQQDAINVGPVVVDRIDGQQVQPGDAAAVLGGARTVTIDGHLYGAAATDPAARVTGKLHAVVDGRGSAIGKVDAAWYIGYGPSRAGQPLGIALVHGITDLPRTIADRVTQIWDVLTTPNSGGIKNFQGPIGIAHDASLAASSGWDDYIFLVALISLSLGIVNVLPIPPFDGGRAVIVIGQALRRRRAGGARLEMALIAAGVLLIGTLAVLISIHDISGF